MESVVPVLQVIESAKESLRQFAAGRSAEWIGICEDFRIWEQEAILLGEPTPEVLADHKKALQYLLKANDLILFGVDPDSEEFRSVEVEQMFLKDSWEMIHNRPSDARGVELNAMLDKVFPA